MSGRRKYNKNIDLKDREIVKIFGSNEESTPVPSRKSLSVGDSAQVTRHWMAENVYRVLAAHEPLEGILSSGLTQMMQEDYVISDDEASTLAKFLDGTYRRY